MNRAQERIRIDRLLLSVAALFLIVAGLRFMSSFVVPFLLSAFVAVMVSRPLNFLKQKRVPTALATALIIVLVLFLGFLLARALGASFNTFMSESPLYQERINEQWLDLLKWLESHGLETPEDEGFSKAFSPGAAVGLVTSMLSGVQKALTNAFLILLSTVFILLEASSFPRKLRSALAYPDSALAALESFTGKVQGYVTIKTYISLATGATVAVLMLLMGIDFAFLLGLLAFLLNFIPAFGSIIAAVPAVVLALVQFGAAKAAVVFLVYLGVNTLFGSILEPRFMGKGLGLSIFVVFASVVFWGWVFGPVGMLLAVPLTMTLKIALESSEQTRWVGVLMGSEPPEETSEPAEAQPEPQESAGE
jgi:predicted PurR-regulated permease PerM